MLLVDHAGVLGGAELSLFDIAVSMGESCTVLLLADGPFRAKLESAGVAVRVDPLGDAARRVRKQSLAPSPGALVDMWTAAQRLAASARDFDVVYANTQKAFVVAALAPLRCALVWHLRDILGPPHFGRVNSRVATLLANRRAKAVIANSQATADAFVAAGGERRLVQVVHNGIEPSGFPSQAPDARAALRRTLGVPASAPLAVHVGRLHPWKGQQVLVQALTHVPGLHAAFVGAALFGEDAFARELRELASRYAVADRAHFLGHRDDIPALLDAADVVVHSSVFPEPFGRVVVEGMLAERPVIASDAGGVRELIANGETGWLTRPGDAAALAAALRMVLADRALSARVAAAGRANALRQFTRDAMLAGVKQVLAAATA